MKYKVFRGKLIPQMAGDVPQPLPNVDSGGIPRKELLLEKTVFPVRQRVPPLLLPTSGATNCPVALLRLTTLIFMIQLCLNWTVSKNAIAAGNRLQNLICFRKMWGCSPTPRQHF